MAPAPFSGRPRGTVKVSLALAGVAVLSAGLLTSCSSSGSKAKSGGSTANTVAVKGFAFSPTSLTVNTGTKVTWKFEDSTAHNVDSTSNAFPKSKDISSGGSYSFTFNTAGTYSYICSIHPFMKGSLTVT